ncbi:Gfo/Idh/MocA family oxidoreductase [Streptomyces sp. NBC_01231]|nr:Gfo/Idh/MocA family oxidoreductase [Streptomyces sp. NBC_01231]
MSAGVRPLRLAALATSSIARRRVLPTTVSMPEVDLVAVAGRSVAKARRFAGQFGCTAETDYAALLRRPDVEAVYISTPTALHHVWADRALRAGKHVLVEKPLGTDADEARRLCLLARDRGLVLRENFMFPYHPQHAFVADLVRRGRIGTPSAFRASFCVPPLPADDIRYSPGLGGGALLDVGVYPLRAAALLLGPGSRVAGATLRVRASDGLDLSGQVLLVAPSGVLAEVTFGFEHAYASSYTLWGDRGRLSVTRAFTPPPDHRPVVVLEEQDHEERFTLPASDQLRSCLRDFMTAARGGAADDGSAEAGRHQDAIALMRSVDDVREKAVRVGVDDCPPVSP